MNDRSYTKLFSSIVTSSLWSEDSDTRIVWVTMLALSNAHGEISATAPGIARVANVSLDSCRSALLKFESPDPDSRTPDNEGRRVERIAGGWRLLNFQHYREMMSKEDRLAYQRAWDKQNRANRPNSRHRKETTPDNTPDKPDETPTAPTQAEAEAEAEADLNAVCGTACEVELPKNFPATIDDAISRGQTLCIPVDFITKIYDKAVSRGGRDSREVVIQSWAHYLKNQWAYEQERIAKDKNGNQNRTRPNTQNNGPVSQPDYSKGF